MIREDLQFKYKVKVQQQDIREKSIRLILLSGKSEHKHENEFYKRKV